jgi:hypothetical protein
MNLDYDGDEYIVINEAKLLNELNYHINYKLTKQNRVGINNKELLNKILKDLLAEKAEKNLLIKNLLIKEIKRKIMECAVDVPLMRYGNISPKALNEKIDTNINDIEINIGDMKINIEI